jgi:sec-independent protein translocase protein TatC
MAKKKRPEYDEDFFADSRMSFGDHLEELRMRLWLALKGLVICMFIGFFLDSLGTQLNLPWLGIGKPVLTQIKKPVEDQIQDFYNGRVWEEKFKVSPPAEEMSSREKEHAKRVYLDERRRRHAEESVKEVNAPVPLEVQFTHAELQRALKKWEADKQKQLAEPVADNADGEDPPPEPTVDVTVAIRPLTLAILLSEANNRLGKRQALTTLSAQEGFIVYFKVTLLCGFVIASPWIFWQFWAFIGAGLYPHEKKYVHLYLPFSLVLFIGGILLCQFYVLPGAVKALLGFNEWLNLDPDLRLNEWLGLALILPLVFGLSFQTPLVMLALNRIGMFSPDDYISKWRYAVMILLVFSAVITPTPDAVTMMYLFIPMIALYILGVYVCKLFPQTAFEDTEDGEPADAGAAI